MKARVCGTGPSEKRAWENTLGCGALFIREWTLRVKYQERISRNGSFVRICARAMRFHISRAMRKPKKRLKLG